jgi:ferredoxin/flavodoxin---NADP+ reductase
MEPYYKEHEFYPVKITHIIELSPGVFMISWKRTISFVPGQVVKIAVNLEMPPRIYSICSGDKDEDMSILFNINPDGYLTPRLASVTQGTEIWISKPYGSFTDDNHPAFWIAAGTGIAPFYSMVRSGLGIHKKLIHGARYLSQFYFKDELEAAMGDNYIRCCSSEDSPNAFRGRITEFITRINELPRDFKYYLCGGGSMVVEVRDLLIDKGIPYSNILSEIYF